jgi:prepilin peptidase CpaA
MPGVFSNLLVAVLAAMLIVAAAGDLRTRTIPNRLNMAIALLAIPFWYASGLQLWPDVALHVGIAALVFLLFAAAFALGAMGGGDVKMVAAIALWLPPAAVMQLLVVMAVAGGVLTLAMLVRHRLARASHVLEIPYGVAIAFAGFWLIGERFLYQFR